MKRTALLCAALILASGCHNPEQARRDINKEFVKAVEQQETEAVQALIPDIDVNDPWLSPSPLAIAVDKGNAHVAIMLMNAGAKPSATYSYVARAASKNEWGLVKELLRRGHDPKRPYRDHTPLFLAARGGRLDVAKMLVERGAQINPSSHKEYAPLAAAASWGHLEMTKWLLEKGARTDIRNHLGMTPLRWAEHRKATAIAKLLRQYGAKS